MINEVEYLKLKNDLLAIGFQSSKWGDKTLFKDEAYLFFRRDGKIVLKKEAIVIEEFFSTESAYDYFYKSFKIKENKFEGFYNKFIGV